MIATEQNPAQILNTHMNCLHVYDEVHRIAARHLRAERPNHTLGPTALVHEAYLRLLRQRQISTDDRSRFLALTAMLMRRVLADHAKRRNREKRGGGMQPVGFNHNADPPLMSRVDFESLNEGLNRLNEMAPTQCQIVEMRFFGGATMKEIAVALGISERMVYREWASARAWLRNELREGDR